MPETGELVIGTIKTVLYHAVFVELDEYDKKEGMINIAEVSAGRIRNIRDFVKEGKQVVCKVLDVRPEKGHIDLSLRRVNQAETINKNNAFKQEQKAEKLLESTGKKLNKDIPTMYKEAGYQIVEEFGSLYGGLQQILIDEHALTDLKIPKAIEQELISTVKEKIKLPEVKIEGSLILQSFAPNGIEIIKEVLEGAQQEKTKEAKVEIKYISAPKYRLVVSAKDYKTAEQAMKKVQEKALELIKEKHGKGEFVRK